MCAAAIGQIAYVIGGRAANLGSLTARYVAVDLKTGPSSGRHPYLAALGSRGRNARRADPARRRGGRRGRSRPCASCLRPRNGDGERRRARGGWRDHVGPTPAGNVYAFDGANMLTGAAGVRSRSCTSQTASATARHDQSAHLPDRRALPGRLRPSPSSSMEPEDPIRHRRCGNSLAPIDPRTGSRVLQCRCRSLQLSSPRRALRDRHHREPRRPGGS